MEISEIRKNTVIEYLKTMSMLSVIEWDVKQECAKYKISKFMELHPDVGV